MDLTRLSSTRSIRSRYLRAALIAQEITRRVRAGETGLMSQLLMVTWDAESQADSLNTLATLTRDLALNGSSKKVMSHCLEVFDALASTDITMVVRVEPGWLSELVADTRIKAMAGFYPILVDVPDHRGRIMGQGGRTGRRCDPSWSKPSKRWPTTGRATYPAWSAPVRRCNATSATPSSSHQALGERRLAAANQQVLVSRAR